MNQSGPFWATCLEKAMPGAILRIAENRGAEAHLRGAVSRSGALPTGSQIGKRGVCPQLEGFAAPAFQDANQVIGDAVLSAFQGDFQPVEAGPAGTGAA
jgi:hypothetical protein